MVFEPANHAKFPGTGSSISLGQVCVGIEKWKKIMGQKISGADAVKRIGLTTASVGTVE